MVRITDVAPRDGLQNESRLIPAVQKVRLVRLLLAAGVDEIEVSSFVSPKWVPQLADAAEVFAALRGAKSPDAVFSALVPNEKGLDAALELNRGGPSPVIDKISVFTAASETFSKRNTNATIAETLDRFTPVIAGAHLAGLATRGYISCVVNCPFEGPIAPDKVLDVARRLGDIGITEIDLGETLGTAQPHEVARLLEVVLAEFAASELTLHLHDTHGLAAESVRAALRLGLRSFDGSAGGLGGCPYASTPERRAPGNIATESLVQTILDAGFGTRIDSEKLAEAARFARTLRSDCSPAPP